MKDLKSALDRIETDIFELKRQYDLYFRGVRRTEPTKERQGLEWMVRQLGQRSIPNTSDQFRFSNLQGRFQSLSNLWTRTVRDLEEGRLSRDATGTVVREGRGRKSPVDREHLETVLEQIREARTECGMQTGPEDTETLRRTLLESARQFADRSGAGKVEFRVSVEGGKPKIRAGKG